MRAEDIRAQPWYREPWPWILMTGPAIVVAASLVTAWLALRSDDGLVVDDYYKRGLAINRTLRRSDTAARLGVTARLDLADGRIRVLLGAAGAPAVLSLRLLHPTRSGMDQNLNLPAVQPGEYEVQAQPLLAGRWHVVLEGADWRLAGDWMLPASGALVLGTRLPDPADSSKEGKQ